MRSISYPFTITSDGKVSASSDFRKQMLDRALTLVSTISFQRMMRPTYGVDISKGLYENANNFAKGMEDAIREAMSIWLPEIQILNYRSEYPNQDGVATITMLLGFPNNTTASLSYRTITISPEGITSYAGS